MPAIEKNESRKLNCILRFSAILAAIVVSVFVDSTDAQETDYVRNEMPVTNEELEHKTEIATLEYFVENVEFAQTRQYEYARSVDQAPWLPEEAQRKLNNRDGWLDIIRAAEWLRPGRGVVFGRRNHIISFGAEGGRGGRFEQLTIVLPGDWEKYETSGTWNRYEIRVGGQSEDSAVAFWSSLGHQETSCFAYASSGSIKFDRRRLHYRYIEGIGLRQDSSSKLTYEKIVAELNLHFSQVADESQHLFGNEACPPFSINDRAHFYWRSLQDVEWHTSK